MNAWTQHGQATTATTHPHVEQKRQDGVLVRMGRESWVISEHGQPPKKPAAAYRADAWSPQVAGSTDTFLPGEEKRSIKNLAVGTPTKRGPRPKMRVRRPLRDSFQIGVVFGLALGCLGLILFHQMPSAAPVASQSESTWPRAAALTGPGVTLPATQVYALCVGVFPNQTSATAAQERLKKQGIATVIYPERTGQQRLIAGIADRPADLQPVADKVQSQHVKAQTVKLQTPAVSTPTLPSVSKTNGQRLSTWLSAEMGAQNALTGALADGEPVRDATTALAQAKSLQPSAQVLSETGYGSILTNIASATDDAARVGLQQHQPQAAQLKLMTAYSLLASLKQHSS